MGLTAYQFVSVQEPRLTVRMARATSADAVVILDLEDSLWDVTDESRTAGLKAAGRDHLLTIAADNAALFGQQRIGVRVNRMGTAEAGLDLEALAAASRYVAFETVIATKVETQHDLARWREALGVHRVAYRELVPIVETVSGLANLRPLLAAAERMGIRNVVYGHYDFALDAGWWPFPEHDEARFWEHVEPLIRRFDEARMGWVHPPFFHLYDDERFGSILGRLAAVCRRDFGVITLGRRQTTLVSAFDAATAERPGPAGKGRSGRDPASLARDVVETFLANKRPTTSFAVDGRSGAFISPHVYLAARAFLERLEEGRAIA